MVAGLTRIAGLTDGSGARPHDGSGFPFAALAPRLQRHRAFREYDVETLRRLEEEQVGQELPRSPPSTPRQGSV